MASFRARTSAALATFVAFLLVLIFGSPSYYSWAVTHKHANLATAGGKFLNALAWPHWEFSTKDSIHTLLSDDLKAILVIVLTFFFVRFVGRGPWSGFRGAVGHFLHGWAAYMFAGAFAGLISSIFVANASFGGAISNADDGVVYGLLVGWIIGLVTLLGDE